MENKQKKTEVVKYEMNDLNIVELTRVDVKEYIGKKAKIVTAEIIGTQYGRAVRYETEILDTLGTNDKPIYIKASKLLSLYLDENGVYGIGNGTKLHEFIKSWKLKNYKDLIGKTVVVQATEEKNGVQFLTFT